MARGSIRKRGYRRWQLVCDIPRDADVTTSDAFERAAEVLKWKVRLAPTR